MPTTDGRISEWNHRASAGTTERIQFTSPDALSSLSVYTGGTVSDVDDLTGATAYAGTLSGGNLIATVDLVVPTGESVALRLVVNGAVQTVGRLTPSTKGTANPDSTLTLTTETLEFALTILGVLEAGGTYVTGVVHGSTAGTARPAGAAVVHWIGSVEPSNAQNNDLWTNTA